MASLIRFVVGGLSVVAVSLVIQVAPFLSGVLSAFPAVFLTSLVFVYLSAGQHGVRAFTKTAAWGMAATFLAVIGTVAASYGKMPWPLVIFAGFFLYALFVSSAIVLIKKRNEPKRT
jgi:hypothetical protein